MTIGSKGDIFGIVDFNYDKDGNILVAGYSSDKGVFENALAPGKIPFAAKINHTTF